MKKITIIIPAYNESLYVKKLLEKVISVPTESVGYNKEIIFIDDGSTDDTVSLAKQFDFVNVFTQENKGKGAAVKHGISKATGDLILIQDADLEYDPFDYLPMLEEIGDSDNVSVYGSRIKGVIKSSGHKTFFLGKHPDQGYGAWIANLIITFTTFILYGKFITDMLTAYKLYPATIMKKIDIKTSGFETDHEISAKLMKNGVKIKEVPISYIPRSKDDGKKIRAIDGIKALITLLKFRILN